MSLRFSFVIPALNEEAFIEPCVKSMQAQLEIPFELIVVDNGSTDRTAAVAERLGCKVVNEPKLGLSYARNRGAEAAQGDILCFVDADGVLSKNYLRAAKNCFAKPTIGAVSGISLYVHPNPLKFLYYNLYVLITNSGVLISNIIFSRMIFAGNNLAMRRELFISLGGYEPVIGEGMWLSRRFWKLKECKGMLCPGMLLWNSPRGFEELGFLRTVGYWVKSTISRKSQVGYTYKNR